MRDPDPSIEPVDFNATTVTVHLEFAVTLQPHGVEDFRRRVRDGFQRHLSTEQMLRDPNVLGLLSIAVLIDGEE